MDPKTWLWRKRSAEKTIVAANQQGVPVKGNFQALALQAGNESGRDRIAKTLNEKLASVILDCNDLGTSKEEATTHDSISDRGQEPEVVSLGKELEEATRQGAMANEILACVDTELKQCKQELQVLRQEREQKMHNDRSKASSEFEKERKELEDKLLETSKKLAALAIENANLTRAILVKEDLVEDLHNRMAQTISEFNALMARLDSTEKENAFLKYEFHMLEKELEIRNEELEYNRQSADATHRKQMESVKTIAKLEAECRRLRNLMRKKLPGPAALTRIKGEDEVLQGCKIEVRRKTNLSKALIVRDAKKEKSPEVSIKNVNFLIEQLRSMEEENRTLLDVLTKKNDELESSRAMFSRTASRLSHVESRLTELTGIQKSLDLAKSSPISSELYPVGGSDIDSIDGVSSSGSWANALISELEHFREGKFRSPLKQKPTGVSEMSLMDDFVEMEKLALVSAETPGCVNKRLPSGKELVSLSKVHSGGSTNSSASDKPFDWIQDVLNAIFKQQRISRRSLAELLQDIKIVLGCMDCTNAEGTDTTGVSELHQESDLSSSITKSSNEAYTINTLAIETSKQCSQSDLSKYICKIIEMVESILLISTISEDPTNNGLKTNKRNPTDYFVHVFQWRSSELSSVLKRFTCMCNDLLKGKAGIGDFVEVLSSTLEWTICNYGTPKDASSARDMIKNQLHLNQPQSETEIAIIGNSLLLNKKDTSDSAVQEENNRLRIELEKMESAKTGTEVMLQSETDKSEALMMQLKESEQDNRRVREELETLRESKAMIEDQVENQKSINEDLDTQLTVTKGKLNEVLQRFSTLEVELEDRSNCCEELEATCLELQLQLESIAKKETENNARNGDGKQPQNGWEITAASIKLAECQETILNLGKQLKMLASPREAAIFDKVFNANGTTATSTTNNKAFVRRFSLRDQMLAEDNAKAIILRSPIDQTDKNSRSPNARSCTPNNTHLGSMHKVGSSASIAPLTIVPSMKQEGFGFIRRLLIRRKKSSGKKSRSLAKVNSGLP